MNAKSIVRTLLDGIDTSDVDRYHTAQARGDKWYWNAQGEKQEVAPPDTKRAAGRNSVTMSRNRNLRARSFGRKDNYSVRDRGWPT